MNTYLPRRIRDLDVRTLILKCAVAYAAALFTSLILAHLLAVLDPYSTWAERIVAPIRQTLVFIDLHWKATILVLLPFLVPNAGELVGRINKFSIGSTSFELSSGGIHPKPNTLKEDAEL